MVVVFNSYDTRRNLYFKIIPLASGLQSLLSTEYNRTALNSGLTWHWGSIPSPNNNFVWTSPIYFS